MFFQFGHQPVVFLSRERDEFLVVINYNAVGSLAHEKLHAHFFIVVPHDAAEIRVHIFLHAADDERQDIVGHFDGGAVGGEFFQGGGEKIVQFFLTGEACLQFILRLKQIFDVVRDPERRIPPEDFLVLEKRHFHRTVPAACCHLEFLCFAGGEDLFPCMTEGLVRVFRELVHGEPDDAAVFPELA